MANVKADKAQTVVEITERFKNADAALLTEYRGLSVSEIAELRNALRDAGTEYKVLKNTLARIAVREVGLEDLAEMLTGPTAIAFIKGDAVEAAKALDDAAKKFPVLVIKGGVLDGKIVDGDQARALAKLEPREVQLTKIVLMINQPLQQTANVLSALLRDFGSMLAQVVAKKESGELPGGSGSEDAAEPGGRLEDGVEAGGSAAPAAAEEAPAEPEGEAPAAPEAEEQAAAAPEADAAQPEATADETPEAAEETEPKEETLENPEVGPGAETEEAPAGDAEKEEQ